MLRVSVTTGDACIPDLNTRDAYNSLRDGERERHLADGMVFQFRKWKLSGASAVLISLGVHEQKIEKNRLGSR
jgi:hypothetical protein